MSTNQVPVSIPAAAFSWPQIRATLVQRWWIWLLPTLAGLLAGGVAAVLQQPVWQASQALLVRDEAIGSVQRHGRFDSLDTMRAFQETVLEVARNRSVVESALRTLCQSPRGSAAPTEEDVRDLQKRIAVRAPKGAEFGRTEVIYLTVTGRTPAEAIARTRAVCDEMERHLSKLRTSRAQSLLAELTKTLQLAEEDLDESTARLESMERELGSDLGELRTLNDVGSSDGNLRAFQHQIEAELRQVRAQLDANQNQRELLLAARNDPDQLVATPVSLVEAQPALKRLKDGLVDAQLRTAELLGTRSPAHPSVISARRAEERVRQDIYQELELALRGIAAEESMNRSLIQTLETQLAGIQARLHRLAGMRARYGNLVADVQQRTTIVEDAKRNLAEARASQSAADTVSLITRFQQPTAGHDPVGPSRKTLFAGGLLGGLCSGVGLLVLTWPRPSMNGRRWSDYLRFGRRASDQMYRRRQDDVPASSPAGVDPPPRRRSQDRTPGAPLVTPVPALAPAPLFPTFSMPECVE